MIKVEEYLPMDLPEQQSPPMAEPSAPEPAIKAGRSKRSKQLALNVRFYKVVSGNGECVVQAASPSAAKYLAFKQARTVGMFIYQGGFLAFVRGGISVSEVRR